MNATFRLMQESGVQGPQATVELDSCLESDIDQAARDWAEGQTGHPWDYLTVECGDETREVVQRIPS